jgi:hypothetical protein
LPQYFSFFCSNTLCPNSGIAPIRWMEKKKKKREAGLDTLPLRAYAPSRLLLDGLRRLLDGGGDFAEEADHLVHLRGREVRGLRPLARADAELDAVILVHRDGRVEHVHGGEHLGRLVDAVGGVARESLDEGGEVRDGHLLRPRALATGEGELDDRHAVVVEADLDALASDGEGGGVGGGGEQLGHDGIIPKVPDLLREERGEPFPPSRFYLIHPCGRRNLFFAPPSFFSGAFIGVASASLPTFHLYHRWDRFLKIFQRGGGGIIGANSPL